VSEPTATGPLVVGYDGRQESEKALDEAFREASQRAVDVVVLVVGSVPVEVFDPLAPAMYDVGAMTAIPPEGPIELQPLLGEARRRLEAAGTGGNVEWSLGDPARELLRVAEERDASAIVVGTHHHSALGRFFGTDVAERVEREARCEVLVAR
jgi:nucleotide-binding universal stress UspA family protein